jgi:hypothetical protein
MLTFGGMGIQGQSANAMWFSDLLKSKKHAVDLVRQRLEWGLFVTPVRKWHSATT